MMVLMMNAYVSSQVGFFHQGVARCLVPLLKVSEKALPALLQIASSERAVVKMEGKESSSRMDHTALFRRTHPPHSGSMQSLLIHQKRCKSDSFDPIKFKDIKYTGTKFDLSDDGILHIERVEYNGADVVPLHTYLEFPGTLEKKNSSSANKSQEVETHEEADSTLVDLEQNQLSSPITSAQEEGEEEASYADESKTILSLEADEIPEESLSEINPMISKLIATYHNHLFDFNGQSLEIFSLQGTKYESTSWRQSTAFLLMMLEKRALGREKPSVEVSEFLKLLETHEISSRNWQASLARFASQAKERESRLFLQEKLQSHEVFVEELKPRLDHLLTQFIESCKAFEGVIMKSEGSLENLTTLASKQALFILSLLMRTHSLTTDEFLSSLKKTKLASQNYRSYLKSGYLKDLVFFDQKESRLELVRGRALIEVLKTHQSLLEKIATPNLVPLKPKAKVKKVRKPLIEGANLVKPKEKQEKISKPLWTEISENERKCVSLNGYATLLENRAAGIKKVWIHLPSSMLKRGIESKRTVLALALHVLSEHGTKSLLIGEAQKILVANQLKAMTLPRDIIRSSLFSYSSEKKAIQLSKEDPDLCALIQQIKDYEVEKSDISAKIKELLPVIEKLRKEHPHDVIRRTALMKACTEEKISLTLPRDISLLFGAFDKSNFYLCSHVFDQAARLYKTKVASVKKEKKPATHGVK